MDQEKLPAALEQYGNALKLYESDGNKFRIAFSKANQAKILARLGRYDEARQLLEQVFSTINESKGNFLQLVPELHLVKAEMYLSKNDLAQATASANEAIKAGGVKSEVAIQAQYVLALVKAASGAGKDALKICDEAIKAALDAGDFNLHSRALLVGAEAALKGNDAQTALSFASQAQERFARGEQLESEWRAWHIASRATRQLGDTNKAEELLRNAQNARSKLEQQWGADALKQYASRPDIQVYYQ